MIELQEIDGPHTERLDPQKNAEDGARGLFGEFTHRVSVKIPLTA